jgi:hypothetical protein
MKKILLFTILTFLAYILNAQIVTNEMPYGLKIKDAKTNKQNAIVLSVPNKAHIEDEDLINDNQPGPIRYAYPIEVDYTLENSGIWQKTDDGGRIWQLKINISGALSTNTYYNKFWLPEGSKFSVYSEDTKQYIGAITSEYIDGSMDKPIEFATSIIYGENVVFEYYQPNSVKESPIISISRIDYGYRYVDNPYENIFRGFGGAASCEINIKCSEGNNWQTEKHAVARIGIPMSGGTGWCSCALVNNTNHDYIPYILTANHCLGGLDAISNNNANQWIFYWEYESECGIGGTEPTLRSTTGATVVANNSGSDFALLRLKPTQDPRYVSGVTPSYLGWDRSENASTSGVCIHHPKGDVKKISIENNVFSTSSWDGTNNHWLLNFDLGVVEHGSSGSPLFNSNKRIVGQLHGNQNYNETVSYCNQPRAEFGKFSVSWTGNGAIDNRRKLQPWLDSLNTGAVTLDGTNIVVQISAIKGPDTISVCGVNTYYRAISIPPPSNPVHWRISSNLSNYLAIEDGENTPIAHIRAVQGATTPLNGAIYLDLLSNGVVVHTYSKNVTVNPGSAGYTNLSTESFSIASNTTWGGNHLLGVKATVESGITLTITGSIHSTSGASIIVEPNGKLILNGATLTNTCGEMWQGIELQNSENGQSAIMEMDGALIENAICAVKFVSDSTKVTSRESTLTATNSTFKNNSIAIDIEKKTTAYTTVASTFNSCNFIIDTNYRGCDS